MKAATTAKIARLIIVIAIVVILAIPTYAGIQSFSMNNGELIATDATYELDCMSEEDIKRNLKNAISGDDGSLNEGFTVSYGSVIGKPVPNDESGLALLAHALKISGEDYATVLDKEGKIVKQQSITGNNTVSLYIYTGLKLTTAAVNTVTPTVSLNTNIHGEPSKISDVLISKEDDSYRIRIEIPLILVATSLAAKNPNINLWLTIDYNSFFTMDIALDVPLSMFTSSGSMPKLTTEVKSGETYDGVKTTQSVELSSDVANMSLLEGKNITIGDYNGTEGGVKVKVDGDKVIVMADKEEIVEALKSSCNPDGTLTVQCDGKTYTMPAEMTASLINISGKVIDQWKGGSA